ncbi:CBS domain-containing protein [Phytomonospora sp. NPDC050363]|uniref:CBS domain-containing protein n=1 Tax=Phytomonospora sp. NPDC050363 TaxID=3155642 RepID=UPI0033C694BB
MRARDLASEFPTVKRETLAIEAARLLAGQDLPGLIVVDDEGLPSKVLPGTQVLRMAVPGYCQDDPVLARVIDESEADLFLRELGERTVGDGLDEADRELPVVDGEATVLEIASVMAASRSPLVAVVEDGRMLGAISLDALLDRVLDLG